MADKDTELTSLESPKTVTDDQIVTERKLPRRSFLNASGAVLASAASIVSGLRASASQQPDPDQKKPADPDQRKSGDPDSRKSGDPDSKKPRDPDQKKTTDPDKPDPRKL